MVNHPISLLHVEDDPVCCAAVQKSLVSNNNIDYTSTPSLEWLKAILESWNIPDAVILDDSFSSHEDKESPSWVLFTEAVLQIQKITVWNIKIIWYGSQKKEEVSVDENILYFQKPDYQNMIARVLNILEKKHNTKAQD